MVGVGPSRRCLSYLGLCGSSAICRAKALHLLPRDWLSWVCRKLLLSGGKRYRRRGAAAFAMTCRPATAAGGAATRLAVLARIPSTLLDVGANAALELTCAEATSAAF